MVTNQNANFPTMTEKCLWFLTGETRFSWCTTVSWCCISK